MSDGGWQAAGAKARRSAGSACRKALQKSKQIRKVGFAGERKVGFDGERNPRKRTALLETAYAPNVS
jgi:hypothetical protein